jgi:hypothetical protein
MSEQCDYAEPRRAWLDIQFTRNCSAVEVPILSLGGCSLLVDKLYDFSSRFDCLS